MIDLSQSILRVDDDLEILIAKIMIVRIFVGYAVLKCLLWNSYLSTDYDVHRNWKQITYNLPLSEWYYDQTHVGTLDYPPFFAYFEWSLASFI